MGKLVRSLWVYTDPETGDSPLELMRLPRDVLMPIVSRLGCRTMARAAITCQRWRSLQTGLESMPAFVSSIATAGYGKLKFISPTSLLLCSLREHLPLLMFCHFMFCHFVLPTHGQEQSNCKNKWGTEECWLFV
jgi:F-box domain